MVRFPPVYSRKCDACGVFLDSTWLSYIWEFDRDHADCKKEKA